MAKPQIDYYLAPQSPWAYLGHERFCALARRTDAQVHVKPCDLPHIFTLTGGLPLAQRAAQRQSYRLLELKRFSALLGIPLNPRPQHFPVSGDAAARLILAAQAEHGAQIGLELAGAIGRALWAEDRNIADAITLEELSSTLGLDGAALLARSRSGAIEDVYRKMTADALAAEVFGAPTYIFAGERYWGQDRLELLTRALTGGTT